jgi:hypothetical protein
MAKNIKEQKIFAGIGTDGIYQLVQIITNPSVLHDLEKQGLAVNWQVIATYLTGRNQFIVDRPKK